MVDDRNKTGSPNNGDHALALWRKRLKYRAWHRGTKELDLILGKFADAHVDGFSADELAQFEAIIEEPEPDIYNWYTGRQPIPHTLKSKVMEQLCAYRPSEKKTSGDKS